MSDLILRRVAGLQSYEPVWRAMQAFTARRTATTPDEIWFMEHLPVYTQGQAGKPEHVLCAGDTPVVQSDRGGQVTWHGPGQLMIYTLLDCKRRGLGARALVDVLEQVVVTVLAQLGVAAHARREAPGVYVRSASDGEAKIAALGLRVKRNGCYHGVALNLDCELAGFAGIHPCGHAGMAVTRLCDLLPVPPAREELMQRIVTQLAAALHCRQLFWSDDDCV